MSVKHKSNSTRNTQGMSIAGTARGDQVQAAQALLEMIKREQREHFLR